MPKLLRDTKQRNAIKRAFFEYRRPLGPKEVLTIASEEVPNLGIATVYRNIKALVEEGELVTIEIPGQPPRYSMPREKSPYLFYCQKSDRVFFLDEEQVNPSFGELPFPFRAKSHEVIFYGEYQEG